MKILFVLKLLIAAVFASTVEEQWQEFKQTHDKTYKSVLEEKRRFAIFKDTLREINEHNVRYARGQSSYAMAVNQFSDMTQAEFEATLTPMEQPQLPETISQHSFNVSDIEAFENINWVTKGYVTPVRDQGNCSSCWAFSAVGALEGFFKKTGGNLTALSPQNLVDCSSSYRNYGCGRGYPVRAFDYVIDNGILEESDYPYVGKRNDCQKKGGRKIKSYYKFDGKDEDTILSALIKLGPLSIAMDISTLKNYARGVVDIDCRCTTRVNHAALLVGAGNDNVRNYWLIKNSFGVRWGIRGYLQLLRGRNVCGITSMVAVPSM